MKDRVAPDPLPAAATVAGHIGAAERIFVLSGAGMSTESGIADFRGPNGLWTRNPAAAKMFDIQAYRADREVRVAAWEQRYRSPIRTAEPNDGHRALAKIEDERSVTIATQNIDGLHQRAGSRNVLELHGTFWASQCLDCGDRLPITETFQRWELGETDPPCRQCGGILRTATVAFGQSLDPGVWEQAVQAARGADLALAIGTSLSVQPAASLCTLASTAGAPVIVVNEQATDFDGQADLVIRGSIGALLSAVARELGVGAG
jgi:NAD-dependent deacetylase